MPRPGQLTICVVIAWLAVVAGCSSGSSDTASHASSGSRDGSQSKRLRVLLIPADGGTEQGTRADFEPIFNAITREHGLHFDIRVGQSYAAVVEGMVSEKVEIAWFGPVSYLMARKHGVAELLAVGVRNGKSTYHSGIFIRKDSRLKEIGDLRGKSIAFGDVNSTSSFNFPIAMIIAGKLDPLRDLGRVEMAGSHANALSALGAGRVDAACASFTSYEKAVTNGTLDPEKIVPLAKSPPIPYPPLAIHSKLPPPLKQKLRNAFHQIHKTKGVTKDMIRGYGGKRLDRYNAKFSEKEFDAVMSQLAKVTDELKRLIIQKASRKK